MKKVLFLMFLLFLMVLGTANVRAQVRIGGNTAPSAAAVLDLNATDLTNNGTGGLTLPRVSLGALSGTSANLNGAAPLTGMLVYNTNSTLGVGVYFWNGSQWVLISGNGVVGNALMDTIAGGGLNKTGTGTAISPYKVGINAGGVVTGMIANGAVTGQKIATVPADSGQFLMSNGTIWLPAIRFGNTHNNMVAGAASTVTPMTVSLIYNNGVNVDFYPNTISVVRIPGVLPGDLCYAGGAGMMPLIEVAAADTVWVASMQGHRATFGVWFRCLRLTP